MPDLDPKVPMMAYPRRSQKQFLDDLNRETKVPTAERIREAIDLLRDKIEREKTNDKVWKDLHGDRE